MILPTKIENTEVLLWTIYKDLNNSFLSFNIPESNIVSRFYNVLWIFRWALVMLVVAVLYKEFYLIAFLVFAIHLVFLIFTIVAFVLKSFLNPVVGVLLIVEEVFVALFTLLVALMMYDEQLDDHFISSHFLMQIITFFTLISFIICVLIEVALIVFSIVAAVKPQTNQRENFVPDDDDANFNMQEENLDDRIRKYQTKKGSGMGMANLNDPRLSGNAPLAQNNMMGQAKRGGMNMNGGMGQNHMNANKQGNSLGMGLNTANKQGHSVGMGHNNVVGKKSELSLKQRPNGQSEHQAGIQQNKNMAPQLQNNGKMGQQQMGMNRL